jgi:nucleotide-binding universal stress UspA family protein
VYRKILFAHDGSERRGEQALPHLVGLAAPSEAEVILCHVVAPPESVDVPDTVSETTPAPGIASNAHLDRLKEQLEAAGVANVSTLVLEGPPAESIVQAVEDLECDAVVVVTAGRGWLGRFFQGSVSDYVARHTPGAAVLLLRDADDEEPEDGAEDRPSAR